MKRGPNDTWTNNYNRPLLKAWNANINIQFVFDAYSCVMYIVSYISKAEHEMSDILKQAQRDMSEMNMSKSLEMKKLLQVYMDNREISAQEVIARVCS